MKEGFINIIIMDKTGWFTTNCLKRSNHIRLVLLLPYSPKMDDSGYIKAKWYKKALTDNTNKRFGIRMKARRLRR